MITNLYTKETDNIGDKVSGALLYFNLGEQRLLDIAKYKECYEEIKNDVIIVGGGGHFHIPTPEYNNGKFTGMEEMLAAFKKGIILWGVGHNIHGGVEINYPSYMDEFLSVGVRDKGTPYPWVPDPSCMSILFDKKYEIKNEVVIYCHATEIINLVPTKFCEGISFEEAIEFLGSANVIYTDSYHGMYWGLLLNKEVIVTRNWSSKFYGLLPFLNERPGKRKDFLTFCRKTNVNYFNKIKAALGL
jgi:hypothetical protein